jgi:glyoxylase-like metal-dependent hydrolase (beta-lactamase superfamily II)
MWAVRNFRAAFFFGVEPMQFGDYRVEVVPDTEFRLDGGAMFGVVPRVLWERVCPPDELNRVKLTCNCLFIDTGKKKILIETGMGEKWSAKETAMYGISRERPFSESLKKITGCEPDEIDIVINTHLHFDHAGGNTVNDDESQISHFKLEGEEQRAKVESKKLLAQFSNARYFVSRSEFQAAENPHERDRASYLCENWDPLIDSKQLDLMPDMYEPVPGLVVEQARGHSETMQTIKLTRGGETLFGFFDMIPTRHHLPLAWIMSYDLYPVDTLEFKKQILPQALEENWICYFYHDLEMPLCRLVQIGDKLKGVPIESR